MVRDSTMITMDSLKETNIALSNSAIADLLRRLYLQKWGPSALPETNSRRVLPPVEYNNLLLLTTSDVAFLQITLAFVISENNKADCIALDMPLQLCTGRPTWES